VLGVNASGGAGNGPTTIVLDLRGSNGDESIQRAVEEGIAQAAPAIINSANIKTKKDIFDTNMRQPRVFGRA